jgi:tetratricopeptide (TPR) repeat protein
MSTPDPRGYYRRLAGQAVTALGTAYVLCIGGTFNGILTTALQQLSLTLLTLGVALWLIAIWRRTPRSHSPVPLGPALALWAGTLAISWFYSNSGRVQIGVWYAALYCGAWMALCDLRQRGLPGRWLVDGALFTAIPLVLFAWIEVAPWFGTWFSLKSVEIAFAPPRPPSALGNPNALGAVLAMLLPFGVVRAFHAVGRLNHALWGAWGLTAFMTLYITYSRGAWLAAASALAVLGLLSLHGSGFLRPRKWLDWWRRRPRSTRLAVLTVGLIGAGMLLVLSVISLGEFDTPRRETDTRVAFYRIAVREFRAHPLTGTGLFTFGLSILERRSVPPEQPQAHAHNLTLNVAAELGLPGLIALAVTALLIIREWKRSLSGAADRAEHAQAAAYGASLVAFGVHSLVDIPMMMPALMLLMLSILASGVVPPEPRMGRRGSGHVVGYRRILYTVLWLAVLGTGWSSACVYARYVHGEQWLAQGQHQRGAEELRRAAADQPKIALYHAEYGYACGLAAARGDISCLPEGIAAYERALALEKPHALWWINLAALYWQDGQAQKAVEAIRWAAHYAPDDPTVWLNLGLYDEERGLTEEAQEVYREVLSVEPLWGHSQFWGESALRRGVLASQPVEPTPYTRARLLWQAGQPGPALAILEQTVEHDPTQPGPYTNIARLYLEAGDLDRAAEYLKAAYALVNTEHDLAWIEYVEAELARSRGDPAQWAAHLRAARGLVLPDDTGQYLFYSRDIAYYQFLRVRVRGAYLPQVRTLGPDPVLVELLQ